MAMAPALLLVLQAPAWAQQTRESLTVSVPNGFASIRAQDLKVHTTAGPVLWQRVWNGWEWKFNPQWESLSQSWANLTGSQAADGTLTFTSSAYFSGGCWAWVDDDWQPSGTEVLVAGVREVGPLIPARSTPFNRVMGATTADYSPPKLANLDFTTLCPGTAVVSTTVVDLEAIRKANELYVGENGRYAFNNRSVLEKRPVQALAALSAQAWYSSLASGNVSLSPVQNAKGYRWIDKGTGWIDYNTQGQVVAWGDLNDNTVWLARDVDGVVRGVVDANGRVVYSVHYTGDLITEVRDYPSGGADLPTRSVKYRYDQKNRIIEVTDARGNTLAYEYDAGNHITATTDQEGRVTRFSYSGDVVTRRVAADGGVTDYEFDYDSVNKQFVSRITGPETSAGRWVELRTHNRVGKLLSRVVNGRQDSTVSYDTGTRTERHVNARGYATSITRDEFDQVVQVQQADGTVVGAAYSTLSLQLTEQTDEAGVKTLYERDAKGNLLKMTQAAGLPEQRVTEYEVNNLGQTTKVTRKGRLEVDGSTTPDAVTVFEYDALGQTTRVTDPEGRARRFVFNRAGILVAETDPLDRTTQWTYDAAGNLTLTIDAAGRRVGFSYDRVGQLVSTTDPQGRVASATYDAVGHLLEAVNPVGGRAVSRYDAAGNRIESTDEDGVSVVSSFDRFHRLLRSVDRLGNATDYEYSETLGPAGAVDTGLMSPTEIRYPTYTRRQRYEALERPTLGTTLNPKGGGQVQSIDQALGYDALGRVKTLTDGYGKSTERRFNALGLLAEAVDRVGARVVMEHDARGNLIRLTDPNGNAYRFAYDRSDRLLSETLPMGQQRRFVLDAAGKVRESVDPLGNREMLERDAVDRVTLVRRYNVAGTQVRTTSYTWDDLDNLVAWSDTDLTRPAGQQTSTGSGTYDHEGRKTAEAVSIPDPAGSSFALSSTFSFSKAGRLSGMRWPDGTDLSYGYSAHGQYESLAVAGEGTITVNAFNWLAPARTTWPGGSSQQVSYDGLMNPLGVTVSGPAQQPLLTLAHAFGSEQELKTRQRTDVAGDGSGSATVATAYTYDDGQRLRVAETTRGTAVPETEAFVLDALGNRVGHSRTTGAWIYDANGRLLRSGTGAGSASYQWSESGNLVQRTDDSGQVRRFEYDTQNRLVAVKDGAGAWVARYGYDPMDRRLWKEQYQDAAGNPLQPASRTYFLYSDRGLIAEAVQPIGIDALGAVMATGPPVLHSQYALAPVAVFGTDVQAIKTRDRSGASLVAYLQNDHLGAPLLAVDRSGNRVWAAEREAFGSTGTGSLAANVVDVRVALPGQYRDDETGLHYNYRRYYDPRVGRYVTSDPIGLTGGVNLYGYSNGDPINSMDPTGECPPCVLAYAACVAGGVAFDAIAGLFRGDECIDLSDSLLSNAGWCALGGLIGKVGGLAFKTGKEALEAAARALAGRAARAEKAAPAIAAAAKGTLDANKAAGKAAEARAAVDLVAEGNKILGSQVSVRTSEGRRVIDHLIQTPSGQIVACEVKCGGAVRNASQLAKDRALATEGGVVVGKNAPDALRGQQIVIPTIERRY